MFKLKKMKFKFIALLVLYSWFITGQTTKFSIEASYPLPIDNNFVGKNFKGLVDLGLKYRIKNLQVINLGLSLNGSMYKASDTEYFLPNDENVNFNTSMYLVQPRVYGELNLKKLIKLHPSIGVGYSFLITNTTFDSQSHIADYKTNQSGLDVNLGVSYDILSKLCLFTYYDYIVLTNVDSGVPKTAYNTNINLLKFGIGLRL
jgi:opacity protein-like surface antigen